MGSGLVGFCGLGVSFGFPVFGLIGIGVFPDASGLSSGGVLSSLVSMETRKRNLYPLVHF